MISLENISASRVLSCGFVATAAHADEAGCGVDHAGGQAYLRVVLSETIHFARVPFGLSMARLHRPVLSTVAARVSS